MPQRTIPASSNFLQMHSKQRDYISKGLCDCGRRASGRKIKVKDLQRRHSGRCAEILITSKDGKAFGVGESIVHNPIPDLLTSMIVYPRSADGPRVLHLHESGETIYSLLRYCYSDHMFSGDCNQIRHLLNVYSLASKYDLKNLKSLAMTSICETYPATIAEWQSFCGVRHPASAVEVFKIMKREGLTNHLRAVYYALCQVDRGRLASSDLPGKVKQQVKSGKYHLARRLHQFFRDRIIHNETFTLCHSRYKSCNSKLLQIVWTAEEMLTSSRWKRDPLDSIFMVQFGGDEDPCQGESLCGLCLMRVEQILREGAEQLWNELPILFHFQST